MTVTEQKRGPKLAIVALSVFAILGLLVAGLRLIRTQRAESTAPRAAVTTASVDRPGPARARANNRNRAAAGSSMSRATFSAAKRDDLRRRIHQALQSRREGSSPLKASFAGPIDPLREESLGDLTREYVQETVREDVVPLVRECYDELLHNAPDSSGKVVMAFSIVGDESVGGIVEDVELVEGTDLTDEDFAECVRESMASATFDPPRGGGIVRVNYPFVFVSQG